MAKIYNKKNKQQAIPVREDARHTIQTYTGKIFDYLAPDQINITDIAHALSLVCRFAGHCAYHYSVAQHSLLVCDNVPDEHRLWGLLHDAAEAYCGDVVSSLKKLLLDYRLVEARVVEAVAAQFGLALPCPAAVHEADMRAIATEKRDLFHNRVMVLDVPGITPFGRGIHPYSPSVVEEMFIERYLTLRPDHIQDRGDEDED